MCKPMAIALAALLWMVPGLTAAAEIVKVAVPNRGAWDTSYTELGLQQGLFKKQGLDIQIIHVADEASLEQALISGSADIAVAAGFPNILAAWVKGAPIRIISPEATGAPDMFWFAKIAGPVASMKDLHGGAVGFSTPGSLSNFILLTLLKEAGVEDARLVPIGAADKGYPLVLNALLNASWSEPPVVVRYLLAGEIRVIARGNDSPEVRNETVRVNAVNANFLAAHRRAVLGFLRAYKEIGHSREPRRRDWDRRRPRRGKRNAGTTRLTVHVPAAAAGHGNALLASANIMHWPPTRHAASR